MACGEWDTAAAAARRALKRASGGGAELPGVGARGRHAAERREEELPSGGTRRVRAPPPRAGSRERRAARRSRGRSTGHLRGTRRSVLAGARLTAHAGAGELRRRIRTDDW